MLEKKPLEGVPVSKEWLDKLLALGKGGEKLPDLKKVVTSGELLAFLRRPEVVGALELPKGDIDFTLAFVDLGGEHRNRLGVTLDPYLYNVALAMEVEKRTGLSLRPCGRLKDLPEHHLMHHMGGPVDEHALDKAEGLLFSDEVKHPGWRDYYSQRVHNVSGACVMEKSGSKAQITGHTLKVVEDVGFFHVKAGDEFTACQLSALNNDPSKGVLIPMVGEFMYEDGKIPDTKLKTWGMERVVDDKGEPLRYPMLAHTDRSLMELCHTNVYVAVVDGKVRLINKPEVVLDILKDVAGEPFAVLAKDNAERLVQQRFKGTSGLTFGEYKRTQLGKAIYDAGMGILQNLPHPEILKRVQIGSIPVCAIQYKGVGGEYHGHYTGLDESQVAQNPNLRFLLKKKDYDSFVMDRRFEGKNGILLTVYHQEGSRDPVGGTATLESVGYEREQRILDNGGFLSGITVGMIKLFDRKQVPNMPVEEVGVAVVAIIDDTRRIEEFFAEENEVKSKKYMGFVVEKYKPPQELPAQDLRRYIEENFEGCRHQHLSEFFGKLGATMGGVLGANLTNPRDQNLMGNISVCGGITDTRALAEMTDQNQAAGFIRAAIYHLDELGRAAGYRSGEIFKTEYFKFMVSGFLGTGAERVLDYVDSKSFRTDKQYNNWVQTTKIIGLMTDAWVIKKGEKPTGAYQTTDAELLGTLKKDPPLMEKTHMTNEQLDVYLSALKMKVPAVEREGIGMISLEEALERHRAGLEDRMDKTPSIYENARAIEAKQWARLRQGY